MAVISVDLAKRIAKEAVSEPFRQRKPLRTDHFLQWLKERGLPFMNWETLHFLWAVGVVRPIALEHRALEETPCLKNDGRLHEVELGWDLPALVDVGLEVEAIPRISIWEQKLPYELRTSLLWHPFQLPTFRTVWKAMGVGMARDMALRGPEACGAFCSELTRSVSDRLVQITNDPTLEERERVTALLLSIEPLVHPIVFGRITYDGLRETEDGFWTWREEYDAVGQLVDVGLTLDKLEQHHRELSTSAQLFDPLRHFRVLLQHVGRDRRMRLKGDSLAAHELYDMAETLRRYLEAYHDRVLPEEDDYLSVTDSKRVKINWFGTDRTADADRQALWRIVRYFGLDPQIRATWFLEGDTEVAFFEHLAELQHIDLDRRGLKLFNLGGNSGFDKNQVLRYMLKQHETGGAFASIALDEDPQGGTRHIEDLKRLDKLGQLTAGYRVWEPDFETANFTPDELASSATMLARLEESDVEIKGADINNQIAQTGQPAGKAIEALRRRHHLYTGKGASWGRCLADVAFLSGGERPAFEEFAKLVRASWADFDFTLRSEEEDEADES